MKLNTGKRIALLFLSALLLANLVSYLPAGAAEALPDFILKSTAGNTVSLHQFKGNQPVLIEFFATWCPHCQEMAPELAKLRNSIPQSRLAILAIDVGSRDSFEKVKRYVKDEKLPYTVLYDDGSKVSEAYGVMGIPYFILLDKTGAVKYQGYELPANVMGLIEQVKK